MADQPKIDSREEDVSEDHSDTWSDVTSSKMDLPDGPRRSGVAPVDASSEVAVTRIRGLRVMVVGEVEEHLHSISDALHKLKIKVAIGAPDGEGYRTGLAFRPDVVVSELTRPGKPGWWLFQRFRRHPMLRWVPVLLMKWWDDSGPRGERVPVSRVVERIADSLAPIRVLEERIRAGRALADRMDTTSGLVLTKVFSDERVTGCLTVNDSWNVFEVNFKAGSVDSVHRRGVDGEADEGEAAFLQFLMCDSGRWSFRQNASAASGPNIRVSLDELMDNVWRLASSLVGPDADPVNSSSVGLKIRPGLYHEIASTLTGVPREIVAAVGSGASADELANLLNSDEERPGVERAISNLLRSGAFVPVSSILRNDPGSMEDRVELGTRTVLAWICSDHGARVVDNSDLAGLGEQQTRSGYYNFSKPIEEEVSLGSADGLTAPGAIRPSMIEDLLPTPENLRSPASCPTPALSEEDMALREIFPDGPAEIDSRVNKVIPHDSLIPGPDSMDGRSKRQMWLAILLAIVLGGLLVAGLMVVNSGSRDVPDEVDRR